MHLEDRLFWDRCQDRYKIYFSNPAKVVEFGSLNVNGSIRESCPCSDYTGIDWRAGGCVDIVSLAHEVNLPAKKFDTVVSASMLEHDPYWNLSLTKMVKVLKNDGILIISWGAAKNPKHELKTAPDGKFHALKAGLVLNKLEELGMYIHEFGYDRSITESLIENPVKNLVYTGKKWGKVLQRNFATARLKEPLYGLGETFLVAFKDKRYTLGDRLVDEIQEWDKA